MLAKLKTYFRLGVYNLTLVFIYRSQIYLKWFAYSLPILKSIPGPFFTKNSTLSSDIRKPKDASSLLKGRMRYFSHKLFDVGSPPNWFKDPESLKNKKNNKHWSFIDDFSQGDIKLIWEPSRFHWLVLASQGYVSTKDNAYIDLMNNWLEDWSKKNPTNLGINWKCGQEASLRVINLILSAYILDNYINPNDALIKMVKEHCRRIYKTFHYAIAQDNNHGTSEMSALFIAGAWLDFIGNSDDESNMWLKKGRNGLEERVSHLVMEDGTFSQYSTNYHRFFLDTVSITEFFRINFNQTKFSKSYSNKINFAIDWLWHLTDKDTGNIPNSGSNDGGHLLQLADIDFRDFRLSIQFCSALFKNELVYKNLDSEIFKLLKINVDIIPTANRQIKTRLFDDGGYVSIINGSTKGLLRYPRFKFRPSQADLLHLDIMHNGITIIGDAGTFSYNKGVKWIKYFSGISSHNTIQFDDSEPMPRLGRFLLGLWPDGRVLSFKNTDKSEVKAVYKDYLGRMHSRSVSVKDMTWTIYDEISGFKDNAKLRWRLNEPIWNLANNKVDSSKANIYITVYGSEKSIKVQRGFQSIFYNTMTETNVLEICVKDSCTIKTVIKIK